MNPGSIEERYGARLITQLEGVLARAVEQERQRWAELFQELQNTISELRSENMRLNIQIQSHQLESTNRALWHKRKVQTDALDSRPTKFLRQQEPGLAPLAPPTPTSSRARSIDVDDELEGLHVQPPSDRDQDPRGMNAVDATRAQSHGRCGRPMRPIARLPRRARGSNASLSSEPENEKERVVYCLCGGHEYGLMIQCNNTKCELMWFHARCVNLKEVPDEGEDWFCPACVGMSNDTPPSRQFAAVAIQTAADSTMLDSGCQTDPETHVPNSSSSTNPGQHISSLAICSPKPQLLSSFVSQSSSAARFSGSATPAPVMLDSVSSSSAVTPISSALGAEAPVASGPESSVASCEKDAVLIHVSKKLISSSRPSLFRMLQPTARKPWSNGFHPS